MRYLEIAKLALALVISTRKLHLYFQAHLVKVNNSHPFRQILQKPDASGRLKKWAIKLGEFDIEFKPRTSIKGQALPDFIAEFANEEEETLKAHAEQSN